MYSIRAGWGGMTPHRSLDQEEILMVDSQAWQVAAVIHTNSDLLSSKKAVCLGLSFWRKKEGETKVASSSNLIHLTVIALSAALVCTDLPPPRGIDQGIGRKGDVRTIEM